ncbi:kelch-like protein 33 isoform X1 [Astyanax mexicanus]|uniref:Kelch-like protein 33 isoform X1 n=2 Tax=Astyanax mexicanus TaxID=7994 RepID=A0A8T2KN09_ASTMX|nr:kelch-like protein 33 isoform X1 [Astyanax mexicanus]
MHWFHSFLRTMSQRQSREKQEKPLSLHERMALFQSSPPANERTLGGGGGGGGKKKGRSDSNSSTQQVPTQQVQTEKKHGKTSKDNSPTALSKAPPSKTNTKALSAPPLDTCHDQELRPFLLPSHCHALFASLCGLKEEGLLLDCSLNLSGSSVQAHQLVLATVSQKVKEWLLSEKKTFKELNLCSVEKEECPITPAGLKTLMNFAYCGTVDVAYNEGIVLEEILTACRCLGAERLAELHMDEAPPSGSDERGRSLQMIKKMWERRVGCDIIIKTENGECFPAHRLILAAGGDYFRALFCGGLRESEEEVVCLRGVQACVLRSLFQFIYSGQLNLGWTNVWDVTEAAMQFQLQGALTLCLNFLQDRMDDGSCLDTLSLAEAYGLEQLGRAAEDYILAHFQRVSEGEKFKDLPCLYLERLLERDALSADSEVAVFRAVVAWVEEDKAQRLNSLPGLLQRIRFPLMTPHELLEVQGSRLLNRNSVGSPALDTVRKLLEGKPRIGYKPRTPNQVLVLVGGDSVNENFERREPNHCLWFARRFLRGEGLIRTVEWEPLARLPEPSRLRHCVCVLNNILYILGGRKYYGKLDILKSAVRFHPAQGRWECLPDMNSPRDYFAAVCCGGKVFVLGGNYDDMNCLDSVEYYTPEENTWRSAHPLDTPTCGHAAAVLDGEIFVSGGCDSHLRCLPALWHYDPVYGCSTLAPMSRGSGRAGHVMLAVGNQLVVAGGLQPMWMGFGDQLQCEAYDLLRNTWTPLPLLPRPHLSPAATCVDGQLYVLGGSSADSARDTPYVHRYDPRENCWDKLGMMPRPYADLAACALQIPISLRG